MKKGSNIGIQEKKAKLFNEWKRFTSTDGESIESYYHRFSKLINDFKRNKHFPKKIVSNLKFLNNLQPEWSRHVTIVHQTKDLHAENYTQLYDLLKYNQKEYPVFHPDLPLSSTYIQQPLPINNNYNPQPSFNQNNIQQPMPNLEDIIDPTTAMNMALVLMAKAFKLNYFTPTNNNHRISSNPQNRQIAQPGNQVVQNAVQNPGVQNQHGLRVMQLEVMTQLLIAQKKEAGIQLQAEEFDLMVAAADLDEIEEVNANCILMDNLQQAPTSGTQTDNALVYDTNKSVEVQIHDNCYNDEIFNMFTQEEQYTELLEPIPEPHQVPHNESNVISEVSSVEQGRGTVEQPPVTIEETRAYQESSLLNLVTDVEKVDMVNCKMRETNAKLTTELARYKNQEKCFEISQEKYDKLERYYQKFVYQEQCLIEKINALHLSSEEKKRLKSDFKIREDKLLDKQIQLQNKIKELDNILVKTGQSIQTMHMLSPKPDSFYHTEQKMALGYQNPFYLKQAQLKQQSLYNGKVLLKKHDPPTVYDSEETLELAQEKAAKFVGDFKSLANKADESLAKHKALELEIERLLRAVVSQDIMSIVQDPCVVDTSNLQTELERMKERFENCIIKKENEYAKLWNDWYKKCEECKYDKISYDKAYNDIQQKIEWLQAQLGDLKGVDITTKTRRPRPRSNTKNDRVPFASKSSRIKNNKVKVEDHPRNLLLSKNKKHMSSEWSKERFASPKPSKPSMRLRWSPTGKKFDIKGKIIASSESNGENAWNLKLLINFVWKFLGTVRFGNDHVAAILGFGDLQWGNILITRVYFVEGLGHNLFSVGQFCDSDLEVAFRRNTCFIRNLEGVDLLKGNHTTNLYTINLYDMASASLICLMARATSTKSWLWHQRLSYLNFDTINDLSRNDFVTSLSKFKYHKEHLCPSCEQGKKLKSISSTQTCSKF
ncbi:retrovirus-related pol polyprotein from transposon TNT 1-94 [Tanacetum coccineum]